MTDSNSSSAMTIFFINKFKWIDSTPMGTVSTLSTFSLAQSGISTYLIIQGDPALDWKKIFEDRYYAKVPNNYHIRLIKKHTFWIKTSITFYLQALFFIISTKIQGKKVVISRNTTFLPYMVVLKRIFRIQTFFESHNYHGGVTLPGIPPPLKRVPFKTNWSFYWIERVFLNHVSGLICIASTQQILYQRDFVTIPTVFLPLGSPNIFIRESNLLLKASNRFVEKRIAYIGRLNHHIDFEKVLDAIKLLNHLNVKFLWIGLMKKNIEFLRNEIEKRNMANQVELMEWISHHEMRTILDKRVSAGLIAYKPSFQSVAITSPSKIFDYFSLGLPVIGPRMVSVTDFLTDDFNGKLYDSSRVESLYNAIEAIVCNSELYLSLSIHSLETAKKYSWTNRNLKLHHFINESIK